MVSVKQPQSWPKSIERQYTVEGNCTNSLYSVQKHLPFSSQTLREMLNKFNGRDCQCYSGEGVGICGKKFEV